jgi:hypothetical protein
MTADTDDEKRRQWLFRLARQQRVLADFARGLKESPMGKHFQLLREAELELQIEEARASQAPTPDDPKPQPSLATELPLVPVTAPEETPAVSSGDDHPPEPPSPNTASKSKLSPSAQWCCNRVRELKTAGQISKDIAITTLARRLEKELKVAVDADDTDSLRDLKYRSIRNELQNWGVWPLDRI